MTTLAVVSGGLREPSSTRLLADRIDAAVRAQLSNVDVAATSSVIELRPLGREIMDAMLTGFAGAELESAFDAVAMRPMFSYLHAVISPTGVYAATDDFGARGATADLSERISKEAADLVRLLRSCGTRQRRDVFGEQLSEMERLLGAPERGRTAERAED